MAGLTVAKVEDGAAGFPLRMRDLVRETGVPAGTLHFYAASGLLPGTRKLNRTAVRYPTSTIARVRWIRGVQQDLRLSLNAIRWVLLELGQVPVNEIWTRLALGEMLEHTIRPDERPSPTTLTPEDIAEMEALGLVAAPGPDGHRSAADQRALSLIGAMRAAGFNRENGFTNDQLLLYRDAMRDLVREETRRILAAGRRLGPEGASLLVERGLPAIDELVRFFHLRAITESIEAWRAITRVEETA